MRVVVVQSPLVWENPSENQTYFLQQLKSIKTAGLIVLPEMFSTGFSMKPEGVAHKSTEVLEYLKPFLSFASSNNTAICGSMMVEENGQYFNRLFVLMPSGQVQHYNKRHLFTFAGEHHSYTAGDKPLQLKIAGVNVAFFVCYDLRFPVWIRNKAEKPYDLAVFVANWPTARVNAWQSLLVARAIENQCYVVGANRIGTDGNGIAYNGCSQLINAYGNTVFKSINGKVNMAANLDLDDLNRFREKFPVLNDADGFSLH